MSAYQKNIINMVQAFSKVCKLEVDQNPKQRKKNYEKEKHIKLNRKEQTKIKDKMSAYRKKIINNKKYQFDNIERVIFN